MQPALQIRRQSFQLQSALQLAGKLICRGGVNAICPGKLLFLQDHLTGVKFLVNTGASVSMLPGLCLQPASSPPLLQLESVTGTTIATGGERRLNISILAADSSVFSAEWNFVISDVSGPILGNDFIKANNFCVDPAMACVRNLQSGARYPAIASFSSSTAAVLPSYINNLLNQFPEVCSRGQQTFPASRPWCGAPP